MDGLIIAILIAGGFILLGNVVIRVSENDSFDAYKRRHPDFVRDGRVTCAKCGGTSILMKQVVSSLFGIKYAHICSTCGSRLYYSRS